MPKVLGVAECWLEWAKSMQVLNVNVGPVSGAIGDGDSKLGE